VGISPAINSIPTKLCFITEQLALKNARRVQLSSGKPEQEHCKHPVEEPSYVRKYKETYYHNAWLEISVIGFDPVD
jgi:hypothetical protein